jgi:hypothetical protein
MSDVMTYLLAVRESTSGFQESGNRGVLAVQGALPGIAQGPLLALADRAQYVRSCRLPEDVSVSEALARCH